MASSTWRGSTSCLVSSMSRLPPWSMPSFLATASSSVITWVTSGSASRLIWRSKPLLRLRLHAVLTDKYEGREENRFNRRSHCQNDEARVEYRKGRDPPQVPDDPAPEHCGV